MGERSPRWLVRVLDPRTGRRALADWVTVGALCGASLLLALCGVYFAQYFMEKGPAFEPLGTIRDGFFRWDSHYYLSIAADGYRYDGDPCQAQNIVFMPAFPLLTRAVATLTGLDLKDSGFLVVRLAFLLGCFLLYRSLGESRGPTAGLFVLLGLCFSAGSFAFHAYYSESVTLLFLGIVVWADQRERPWLLALAAAALGASRVTVAPICLLFALRFISRAYLGEQQPAGVAGSGLRKWSRALALATLSVAGVAGYLLWIQLQFGNPLELIASIKYCAWSKVHQPMKVWELITFAPLLGHIGAAWERPYFFVLDVKTTNLMWTLAALATSVYTILRRRWDPIHLGFVGYFLLTFYANGASEWLESSYRYYTPMFPVFLMAHDLYAWLGRRLAPTVVGGLFLALLAVGLMYMVCYAALFAVQRWHYF